MLREVFKFSNDEAAKMVGVSGSVLRHHLEASRKQMEASYEALCALVNKNGVCYQCRERRELATEAQRGPPASDIGADDASSTERFRHRLRIARESPLASSSSRPLHDLIFRRIAAAEQARPRDERSPATG